MTLVGPAPFNYSALYNAIPAGTPIDFDDIMKRYDVAKYCVEETRHEQIESVHQAVTVGKVYLVRLIGLVVVVGRRRS